MCSSHSLSQLCVCAGAVVLTHVLTHPYCIFFSICNHRAPAGARGAHMKHMSRTVECRVKRIKVATFANSLERKSGSVEPKQAYLHSLLVFFFWGLLKSYGVQ